MSKTKKPTKFNHECLNFYTDVLPDEYKKAIATYANHDDLKIDLPIRCIIAGSSGSGKTNAVMNVIDKFNCFDKFYLYVGDESESLYHYLIDFVRKRFGKNSIVVSNDINEIPAVCEFNPKLNNLVIIDDLLNEKVKNPNCLNVFTNGRKQNVSIIYITQDYFKVNITVRKNSKVIILTRFDDSTDLKNILTKYKQNMSIANITSLYKYSTDNIKNFFLIDTEGKPHYRYRKNFMPIG
jgi:hypothetical protein